MSGQKLHKAHGIPVFGIFLLFLGIVFLLQTLNVLPWGVWGKLWRFWPVLIIIAGLSILLRRYNLWLVSALILALLFACLGIAIWQHGLSLPPGDVTESLSEPLDGLASARVQIDLTAGSLTVGNLPATSPNFAEAYSRSGHRDMRASFQRQGDEGVFYFSTEQADRRFWKEAENSWEIRFARNIPLTMAAKSAAGNLELDLGELKVTDFQMEIDAGNCLVKMPASAGTTSARIKADVVNLEVTVPEDVAAKIRVETDLSAFEIDEGRFPREGDNYISPNFESARNRVELELDCDIGRVKLK